jgi:nucleoside-diphosphate-sugar epimerase
MKKVLILGETGNLSNALNEGHQNVELIPRHQYLDWIHNPENFSIFFKAGNNSYDAVDIVNCAGIIDPRQSQLEIDRINYTLPLFLSEQSQLLDFRLITFGTIMENFESYCHSNPYLMSKHRFFRAFSDNQDWVKKNIHIQMHTHYGGRNIQPRMFLGQIFYSIKNRREFEMSPGNQIREYHHLEDDVRVIYGIMEREYSGVKSISHGEPIKLMELAYEIFTYFNAENLLHIAKLPSVESDNDSVIFHREEHVLGYKFRPILPNVFNWFENLGLSRW